MHPIIFKTGFFTLHTLWIFNAIAILVATYALIKLSIKSKLKIKFISDHFLTLAFWSLVGARILSVIENFQFYFYELSVSNFLRIFHIWDNGLTFLGALIGFAVSLYFLCKKNEQDFWHWLDVIVPSAIIMLAISHVGAFFDGIHYGNETGLPWGVNFENPAIKYAVPIHPTQIYAALYSAAIAYAIIHFKYYSKKTEGLTKGVIALCGILAYNIFRFFEEFLRGDDILEIFGIRLNFFSTFLIIALAGFLLKKRLK